MSDVASGNTFEYAASGNTFEHVASGNTFASYIVKNNFLLQRLAIIGTGIAGMSCGYFLHKEYDLTVYEQGDYVGGHTNTVSVDEDGKPVHFDTGFMVFNHETYPYLTKLFAELKVETKKTSMSFSVQHVPTGLEYCGSGMNGLFAQRKNIFSPKFIRMLMQISRFNKEAIKIIQDSGFKIQDSGEITVEEFCAKHNLGDDFLQKYLIPMSGAVWSTPPEKMLGFPALTLMRFFYNHGFLGLDTQHQWWTVSGGSKNYRDKIIAPFKEKIMVNNAAVSVLRDDDGVIVKSADGKAKLYDKVIFACHGDEAFHLLKHKTADEERLLSCFSYQPNRAIIHTDESVMPKTKAAWSSWNYRISKKNGVEIPSTIYWMNSLQGCSDKKNYFVSINSDGTIAPEKIIREIDYTHPLFDVPAINAQKELPKLNETGPVYFCGSYFRYGFHEDALLSSVQLCEGILGRKLL
ncbi:MAG: FAD-dependent oxidoreductase [Bacteroidota bacterium]|nr:FAD-dependent oxidoreductase [Bacteroidota bacterium]